MARYYGIIGFYFDEYEVRPGVWDKKIVERTVYGEFIRNTKRTENQGQSNDSITINNQIKFIAEPYVMENFQRIKYATYMGSKWAVTSAEPLYPNIILTLGGLYNDKQPT